MTVVRKLKTSQETVVMDGWSAWRYTYTSRLSS